MGPRGRSIRLLVLGTLAGLLAGSLAAALIQEMQVSERSEAPVTADSGRGGVKVLSGGGEATVVVPTSPVIGPRAEALRRIVEARLRADEPDLALETLDSVHLEAAERDFVLGRLADVVLPPFTPGGEEARVYLDALDGRDQVVESLVVFYNLLGRVNDPVLRVQLLVRMKNVYDLLGAKAAEEVHRVSLPPTKGKKTLLAVPAAYRPIDEATEIARAIPETPPRKASFTFWNPWSVLVTALTGLLGLVLTAILQGISGAVGTQMTKEIVDRHPQGQSMLAALSELLTASALAKGRTASASKAETPGPATPEASPMPAPSPTEKPSP